MWRPGVGRSIEIQAMKPKLSPEGPNESCSLHGEGIAFFAAGCPVQLSCFGFSDVCIMTSDPDALGWVVPPGLGRSIWALRLRTEPRRADVRRPAQAPVAWQWQGYRGSGSVSLLTSQWKSGKMTLVAILPVRLQTCGVLACRPLATCKALVISRVHTKVSATGSADRLPTSPFSSCRGSCPHWVHQWAVSGYDQGCDTRDCLMITRA